MKEIKTGKSKRIDKLVRSMLHVLTAVGIPLDTASDRTKVRCLRH